jgi:uncharacterized glyoxalase superfamily protein PhnB
LSNWAAWTLNAFQVNLYAEHVEAATAFYSALGFEQSYRYPAAGAPEHVEVRSGGLTIGVSSIEAARVHHGFEPSQDGSSVEIVLWCSDSDAAYAQALSAGVASTTLVEAPAERDRGAIDRVVEQLVAIGEGHEQ